MEEVVQQLDQSNNLGSRIVYTAQIIILWASAICRLIITPYNLQTPRIPSFKEDPKL